MEGFLDYKSDSKGYIYAKLYDCLVEGRLALEMMRKGLLQNASSKAFLSVKSAVSALVVKNLAYYPYKRMKNFVARPLRLRTYIMMKKGYITMYVANLIYLDRMRLRSTGFFP